MVQAARGSKRKSRKAALVLGAAGVSLAMGGGASATAPATNVPSQDNARRIVLGEEEVSDVSLATFHVFDKENKPPFRQGLRLAAGGCGGHGGGCGGCGGHGGGCGGHGGCAAHVGCAGGCAAHVGCAGGCRCAGHGCRGCRGGYACAGVFIGGACLGCAADYGTCWQWDPYLGQWINVCY
jgi:hypothetical protein